VWKNDKCRGEHLQNLQKNLGFLERRFENAASEAEHLAYHDAPNRKIKKAGVTPGIGTLDYVHRCSWMVENTRKLLELDGKSLLIFSDFS
jgi:hypothetical protein